LLKGVFRLNDERITVPAFSFEKISAPPQIDTAPQAQLSKQRGRFARLVDRLAEIRLRSYDVRGRRFTGTTKPRKNKPL
jgi:hypothetical protein